MKLIHATVLAAASACIAAVPMFAAAGQARDADPAVVDQNRAPTLGDKTRDAAAAAADKSRDAAAAVADKTRDATAAAKPVVADTVITTKVKADIFKEPALKSMAIHVETQDGVVMLSGFVDTAADAERAATLARGVNGVADVKSAIKVR
jgi:hyperosmotically inducible protein